MNACPDVVPLTPVGRLEAMEKRLDAMVQAGKTVQPAMEEFYVSLSNEQKARFNTLGQQARARVAFSCLRFTRAGKQKGGRDGRPF